MSDKKTLSSGQIAKYCDVNLRTVTRWIANGHLKAHKLPGRGNNRITIDNFLEFLKQHNMPIPQDLQSSAQKVLIVDDETMIVRSLQRLLKRKGYQTETASDGFQAGIKLTTFNPHLMTLDIQMPGSNGYDVIRFAKKHSLLNKIKILVISALPTNDLKKAVSLGAHDYLAKPFQNDEFLQKIDTLISN